MKVKRAWFFKARKLEGFEKGREVTGVVSFWFWMNPSKVHTKIIRRVGLDYQVVELKRMQ